MALGADLGGGPLGTAGAAAGIAGLNVLDGDLLLTAEGGLLQRQVQGGSDGLALGGTGAALAAAAEAPEAAAEEGTENVPHVEAAKAAAGSSCPEVGIHAGEAELVVLGPLVLVGEDLIGLVDLLEAGLGLLIPGVQVRVVLLGQLPVCFLQFIVRSALFDAQDFIIVSFILVVCHWDSPHKTGHILHKQGDRKSCPPR